MRFPLGLAADLAMGRAKQILRGLLRHQLFLHLSVFAESPISPGPLASCVCLTAMRASSAPVVWIGGSEPLLHPEIGRLARRMVDAGRHVFVTTDGALLHRRIHEFRPVSRLFLTVQFHGSEQLHDRRAGRDGAFRDALNGIRTAKLSGFLVCAEISVYPGTEISELENLREILTARDVDGFAVRLGRGFENAEQDASQHSAIRMRLNEAQARISDRRWRWFSRLLNESLAAERMAALAAEDEPDRLDASEAQTCEESVPAQ
jgi:molybdenum cofactor biosynthesis enzyme MoaA